MFVQVVLLVSGTVVLCLTVESLCSVAMVIEAACQFA